ncbi:hypothetical protein [Caulifigura coniformis]|uniref:hypothetical protein n=1 Tax=Caulifigura coniformis TaxID=2527983 RepID=UPI0018D25E7A|nr:hypothetical protein [Caulifigura coniformis]
MRTALSLKGFPAAAPRKNDWQVAEFAGDESPRNVQQFIARATWRVDAVRDDR